MAIAPGSVTPAKRAWPMGNSIGKRREGDGEHASWDFEIGARVNGGDPLLCLQQLPISRTHSTSVCPTADPLAAPVADVSGCDRFALVCAVKELLGNSLHVPAADVFGGGP